VPWAGQVRSNVNIITVGSVAASECGAPGGMCSHDPGPRSSCSPSTVKRSRPERTWTTAARAA
jgi:hypothetical protein